MRRPQGHAIWSDPDAPGGVERERDTFTCGHCQRIVFVKPRCDPSEAGGLCHVCMRLVCGPCADRGKCDPFEKKLEREESRDRSRREYESVVGPTR